MNVENQRNVKVLTDCKWEDLSFRDIRKGMNIKLFESDGKEVLSDTVIHTESDAFENEDGIWTFEYNL